MLLDPLAGQRMGGDFVVAEWKAEPADYWIAPLHVHHQCDEAWYVLQGSLEFRVGGETFVAPAGSGVYVPKNSPHSYRNASTTETRYLIFMTEKTDRLIRALHELQDRNREAVIALFRAYDAELLG